jgi:hypothetical protein
VQGDLLLRDGVYMTEEPEVLKLAGVYVASTGQLHARVQPVKGPIFLPVEENSTVDRDTPDYRCKSCSRSRLAPCPAVEFP